MSLPLAVASGTVDDRLVERLQVDSTNASKTRATVCLFRSVSAIVVPPLVAVVRDAVDVRAGERDQEDARADLDRRDRILPAHGARWRGVDMREAGASLRRIEPEQRRIDEAVERVASLASVELERVRARLVEAA